MGYLNTWVNLKITDIANKLPTLVHNDPASFSCGYNAGYKNALLDLDRFMTDLQEECDDVYCRNIHEFE